jgi:predicted nucleic acid-binding protein
VNRFALDTGPIVAFLNRRDTFHEWARDALDSIKPPVLTCEAVLSEACFLLRHTPRGPDAVLELVNRGLLRIEFCLADHVAALRKLLVKYKSVPISLADACLVRMSDLEADMAVVTLDSDFRVYRRLGRQQIPLVAP